MLVTEALFLEYEEVLSRPEQRVLHGISLPELDVLLRGLAFKMEAVEVYFHWRPQVADPDDEMVVEAALNGRADVILTHNVRDFAGILEKFNVRVLRPSDLLKELGR
jgi:predicted nucleic acid-binding protein